MSTLFGNNISQTYQGLIKLADSTTGVTATTQSLQDGLGNNIPIQVSNTTVNISGSFLVNGQPVSIETGSFATTGSNTFIGNQTITGSVNVTGTITANSASFNYLETVYETASIIYSSGSNQFGDASDDTQTLWGTVNIPSGSLIVSGSEQVIGVIQATDIPMAPQYYAPTVFQGVGQTAVAYDQFVNGGNFDSLHIETNLNSGSKFQDYDLTNNNLNTYLQIPTNTGNNPSPQFTRGLGITGSLSVNGNTTISGSIIGNTVNGGLIKIQTEANRSGSIQFNITGSNQISQSNFVFGIAGPASVTQTGSIILSGSNNIILNGFRLNTLPSGSAGVVQSGTFGYINGNNNFVSTIPVITTGSLGATISNNQLNGLVIIDNPATSSFGTGSTVVSSLNGNLILLQGTTLFRHKSGSFNHNSNITLGGFNSYATSSWFSDSISTVSNIGNILQGSGINVLHISSSVLTNRNIINSNNTTINNQFTNPNNYTGSGSGSVSLSNNIFGGVNHTILSSGSNTANRNITNNLVVGSGILLNQISSGSFNTVISNTAVLGASLIISGSNSSTTGGGSVIVGRYNATGSNQETTNETVFVVGTGTNDGNRRNALRIDNNNNSNFTGSVNISGSLSVNGVVVSSDRNGLITTGSYGGAQSITGSLSMTNGGITILGAGSNLNIQSGSINLNNDGQSQIGNQGSGRNVLYVDNTYSNFFFGNVPKGQSGRFSGDTNNFILSPTYSDFQSGSNNLIFAVNNSFFQSGSRNIFIGDGQPFGNSVDDSLYIGMNGGSNQSIITKRGGGSSFPIQLGFPTQVTGSLNVAGNAIISGSLLVTDKINNLKIWTGSLNTDSIGIGTNTLNSQTGSSLNNIAIGGGALATNITGANVVAIGGGALGNSVAGFNVALGGSALSANTTGQWNIAIGQSSFQANTTGDYNTTIGWNSAVNNTTGSTNTAIGAQALENNISGSGNVAIGRSAGYYSTGSNGFYVGNENYGSLNNEQNKSLFYGEFNSTTANQTLQINAQTNIVGSLLVNGLPITGSAGGDRNGLINTGSIAETQSITGSLIVSGSQTITGSLFLNNNNNTIISSEQTIPSGSGNVIIGSGSIIPNNLTNNIVIGAGGNSIFTYNGGSDRITLQKGTTLVNGANITGSVIVEGTTQLTGSLFVSGSDFRVTGSVGTLGTITIRGNNSIQSRNSVANDFYNGYGSAGVTTGQISGFGSNGFRFNYGGILQFVPGQPNGRAQGIEITSGSLRLTGSFLQTNISGETSATTSSLNVIRANNWTVNLADGVDTFVNVTGSFGAQTIDVLLNTTGSSSISWSSNVKQASGSIYVPSTGTTVDIVTLKYMNNNTSSFWYMNNVAKDINY